MAKIIIAGGSGMLGKELRKKLVSENHEVIILSRNKSICKQSSDHIYWNPEKQWIDPKVFLSADVLINLCGSNIGQGRWTSQRKKELLESRILPIHFLVDVFKRHQIRIPKILQASAIGIYGEQDNESVDENTRVSSTDFLSNLCLQWEKSGTLLRPYCDQLSLIRIGVVLDKQEGMLAKIASTSGFKFIACFGKGRETLSWISGTDFCNIVSKLIDSVEIPNMINLVSPNWTTYGSFYLRLKQSLKIPFLLRLPEILGKWIFGEMFVLLKYNQKVKSKILTNMNYQFIHPSLEDFLKK